MKKYRIISLIVLVSLMFMSCATLFTKGGADYREAEKNYKEGDYVSAIRNVLIALEKNPEFPEALELFPKAFNGGTDALLAVANEKTPANADKSYKAWQDLVEMNVLVADSGRTEVSASDYSMELDTARQYVLEVHYNYAVELLNSGERDKAIEAVDHFYLVSQIEPKYLDVELKFAEAVEAATIDIAVDAGLPGEAPYAELYYEVLSKELNSMPYVRLVSIDKYITSGREKVPAIDVMTDAIGRGELDYAIMAYSKVDVTFSNDNGDEPVTRETEVSPDGNHVSVKYKVASLLEYEVFGPGPKKIDSGKINEFEGNGIWFYNIMGRVYKDFDLQDGNGKHNIIVAEMYNDDRITDEQINEMLDQVTKKTLNYKIPAVLAETPYDHAKWKEYFINNYDFNSLSKEFEDAWFTNAVALFKADKKHFWLMFSSDTAQNEHYTKLSSAIYQGLAGASYELVEEAVKSEDEYHEILAGKLAEYIKANF